MTPDKELEVIAFRESVKDCPYDDLVGKNREMLLFLCDSALRLAAIEGAGDEEVEMEHLLACKKECEESIGWMMPLDEMERIGRQHIQKNVALLQVITDLRAKLGEAEKAIGNPSEIPNTSRFLVTEADQREADKVIADGSAKLQMPETGHGITEVTDAAEGG